MRIETNGWECALIPDKKGDGIAFNSIREQFSVLDPERFAVRSFQNGYWDGRHYTIDKFGVFLRGMAPLIVEWAASQGMHISWDFDLKLEGLSGHAKTVSLHGITPYDHQRAMVEAMLGYRFCSIEAATGAGKTEVFSMVIKILVAHLTGRPIFFLVHRIHLIHQSLDRLLARVPELKPICGKLGDGEYPHAKATIIFATHQSLSSKMNQRDEHIIKLWKSAGAIMIDECHRVAEDAFLKVLKTGPSDALVYQLSGTPEVDDQMRDWTVVGVGGPIRLKIGRKMLEGRGVLAEALMCCKVFGTKPKRGMTWLPEPKKDIYHIKALQVADDGTVSPTTVTVYPKKDKGDKSNTPEGIVRENGDSRIIFHEYGRDHLIVDVHRNADLYDFVKSCNLIGRKVLVVADSVAHVLFLYGMFKARGLRAQAVHGDHSTKERQRIIDEFESGNLEVMVASSIFTEGVDAQGVGAVALPGVGKSLMRIVQYAGRGVRRKFGFKNVCPIWVGLGVNSKFEKEHSIQKLVYFERAEMTTLEFDTSAKWIDILKELCL